MDGASSNVDSDHSLTWEDFFGSTTDLTPTLIGIYDSLLEPPLNPSDIKSSDTKENTPCTKRDEAKRKMAPPISDSPSKDPRLIAGGIKLPGFSKEESPPQQSTPPAASSRESTPSKMSYVSRFKSFALRKNNTNEENGTKVEETNSVVVDNSRVSEKPAEEDNSVIKVKTCDNDRVNVISKLNSEVIAKVESNRKQWADRSLNNSNSFDNLSPNVKRMLSSAGAADTPCPKPSTVHPKKQHGFANVGRSSGRTVRQSNIPLMGATSKITQSGVDIVSTADIYDTPAELTSSLTKINVRSNCPTAHFNPPSTIATFSPPVRSNLMSRVTNEWSSATNVSSFSPEKRPKKAISSDIEDLRDSIYDVPANSSAIYDVPTSNKKAVHIDRIPAVENQRESKNESMDDSTNDFVVVDSPETVKNQMQEVNRAEVKGINPSKPVALNMALAIRNLADTETLTKTRHGRVFDHDLRTPNASMLYSQVSGSTGNLKIASSSDRDMAQVTRPLSMSSIASSSSTSSSGAQNKGGGNSAYLASIESLDDHSDAESGMVFVKSARLGQGNETLKSRDNCDGITPLTSGGQPRCPTPPRPRYCDPALSPLQRICIEIVDTEGVYVEDLRQVVEGYLHPWRECNTFSPEDLDHLFSNIEEIYHFNRAFSLDLDSCRLVPAEIACRFASHGDGFRRLYARYCTAYPATMAALARLAREPPLRRRQAELRHALPLGSYLLKPVQRILKYHLLLLNLVKQCNCQETEHALHKMTGIAQHINEMKKRHEHTVRVQEIQSLLYGWNGQDLTTYGELCAEGTFRVFGAKAMRHAFLFDKMLLLTKNKEDGILAYKSHIMCNNLMLVESIQGQPLSFHVIPFDCPRMQVTLQARSIQHKREWTLLLKRVILENYNAVIPSHARQLVMELGQNKTDDDMLAEKSSTLISHSSMRKQLSAPEYLEKRKLERERRKSFESGLRHKLKRSTTRKGQNGSICENDTTDKDGSTRNDSAFEEFYRDCQNTCSHCSDMDLCKDCPTRGDNVCRECKDDSKRFKYSNYSSNKCYRCNTSEFQSQSSIDVDYSDKKWCVECDRSIHYIDDQSSRENITLDESHMCGKCLSQDRHRPDDFNCSVEEMAQKHDSCTRCNSCNSKSILSPNDYMKKQLEVADVGDDRLKNREFINIKKTCLKCQEIKENITVEDSLNYSSEIVPKCEHEYGKVKRVSKDDSQTLTVPKISGTVRRKSEPGMSNINFDPKDWKKSVENEMQKNAKSQEELSFNSSSDNKCRECGRTIVNCSMCGRTINFRQKCMHNSVIKHGSVKNVVERKCRSLDREANPQAKITKDPKFEVKMYNSKTVPKKISKIKKNRAKTLRHLAVDSTAKFYTDFTTDNVLHISESTDSINTLHSNKNDEEEKNEIKEDIHEEAQDETEKVNDIDDEMYKTLIQKTDSFKQSELEKDKTKKISSVKEADHFKKRSGSGSNSPKKTDSNNEDDAFESCDEGPNEKPLEQIISQLLMQNREFQKILKRHQLRNATNRRHQRLLKSHSNPEKILMHSKENLHSVKPKFGRQTSAVENIIQDNICDLDETITREKQTDLKDAKNDVPHTVEEHIYETLVVSPDKTKSVGNSNFPESAHTNVPYLSTFASPKKDESNINKVPEIERNLSVPVGIQTRVSLTESDYVYLCFDGNKNVDAYRVPSNVKKVGDFQDNGEYAVPTSTPQKVPYEEVERRVLRDKVVTETKMNHVSLECHYDNTSEVWKRISNDTVIENPIVKNKRIKETLNNTNIDDYLEMENGPQSPNLPEIWLKNQKEHFTTSRDKKSGSLPRSFQVNLNELEEKTSPKGKPVLYNKVYLNKDGKVLQTDRPFTIASDYSEISYEDIERFIKGDANSALKFPRESASNRSSRSFVEGDSIDEAIDSISRSTLELEAEIDRCYKNNIEMRREQMNNLTNSSNNNLLLSVQNSIDHSISSSMEVMNEKTLNGNSQEDLISMHPEHKIYKTTINLLSLKSVLNRFKSKTRSNQEQNNQSTPNSDKDCKDKTDGSEFKRAVPKHQSRNLMQRFKSIIHDEQNDNVDTLDCIPKEMANTQIKESHNPITVTVTRPDDSPVKTGDIFISKSFCETKEPELNPSDHLSKSCNNILLPFKSTDNLTANVQQMSNSVQFTTQNHNLVKSAQNSVQDLNKLPIYKQGSRHLGARIAQSDYADPKMLFESNSDLDKVNVFINKNALRPDSLLSNSSHFTSSSEGYANPQSLDISKNNSFLYRDAKVRSDLKEDSKANLIIGAPINKLESRTIFDEEKRSSIKSQHELQQIKFNYKLNSDDSYYEKSFDEIEQLLDNEIFRDSAIYSDPDDSLSFCTETASTKNSNRNTRQSNVPVVSKDPCDNPNNKENIESVTNHINSASEVINSDKKISDLDKTIIVDIPDCVGDNPFKSKDNSSSPKLNANCNATSISFEKKNLIRSNVPKPAPPVPIKPSLKINLGQSHKVPSGIESAPISKTLIPDDDTVKETFKSDLTKPTLRYIPRKDKILSSPLKITEAEPEKVVVVETEKNFKETETVQHLVDAKLNLNLKPLVKPTNIFQFPSPKSPTDKTKVGIPRPSFERPTSSNIRMKRLSFERCSLDSSTIARRSRSVSSNPNCNQEIKTTNDDSAITKSVQERKKEIERITSDSTDQRFKKISADLKVSRKSSSTEYSAVAFTRSVSMKVSSPNVNDNLKTNDSIPTSKVPSQRCNIPLPNTSSSGLKLNTSFSTSDQDIDNVKSSINESPSVNNNSFMDRTQSSPVSMVDSKSESFADAKSADNAKNNQGVVTCDNSRGGWVKHVVNRFQ